VSNDVIAVRAGDELAWPALERHLRDVLDVPPAPMNVRQFGGGRANLTYLVAFGESQLVVRRPPRGKLAPGAHDMEREFRVLSALGDAYARAPRALHYSADESILGAPFVVIEHRDGVVVRDSVPESMAHHADVERRIDVALVHAAADLHAVDAASVGLGELGRAEGFGRRQVDGWLGRWRRASGGDGGEVMDHVAERLSATLPEPTRAAIVHNDLKLDNCQFAPQDPDTVTSVFDWDMATLGDPLFDLGLLLVSMETSPAWVLSTSEAVDHYATRSGIDVRRIDWYLAFATWRTAIVLQQLYNRYLSGDTADERYATFGASITAYADRARELVEQ
jgi:aminoglycoside phosphotransferase (APT) family kinase protein